MTLPLLTFSNKSLKDETEGAIHCEMREVYSPQLIAGVNNSIGGIKYVTDLNFSRCAPTH